MDAHALYTMCRQARAMGRKPLSWRIGYDALYDIMRTQWMYGPAAGAYIIRPSYSQLDGITLFGLPVETGVDIQPDTVLLVLEEQQ